MSANKVIYCRADCLYKHRNSCNVSFRVSWLNFTLHAQKRLHLLTIPVEILRAIPSDS